MKTLTYLILFSLAASLTSATYLDQLDRVTVFLNKEKIGKWTESSQAVNLEVNANLTDTLSFFASTDWGGLNHATLNIMDTNGQLIATLTKTSETRQHIFKADYRTDLALISKSNAAKFKVVLSNMDNHKGTLPDKHLFNLEFHIK